MFLAEIPKPTHVVPVSTVQVPPEIIPRELHLNPVFTAVPWIVHTMMTVVVLQTQLIFAVVVKLAIVMTQLAAHSKSPQTN